MTLTHVANLFTFIGGLGMFLYGMDTMAAGLQRGAGNRMKRFMGALTNNRFLAVALGALITAIIQSSSATTVMVVGFVNAGLLNLYQAVGVIMGANIGTTITAWLVSMSELGSVMKPEFYAPLVVGFGAFILLFNKSKGKKMLAEILIGFGLLFIGLSFMSSSIAPYRDAEVFKTAFRVLGKNPILGILTGAVVTGIIQSSSASLGILQTLAINGVVNWQSAVFIMLGQNIGTCVTALLSSMGASKNAKRASVIHLLFNVFGAVFFGIIMFILFQVMPSWAGGTINTVQIAIFHSLFNVTVTILLFPFAKKLVHLSERIIPDKISPQGEIEDDPVAEAAKRLDKRVLSQPAFALEAVMREVIAMGNITLDDTRTALAAVVENDAEKIKEVRDYENILNQLEKMLTEYLVKVSNLSLSPTQHEMVKNLLYTIHDMERIGDHCDNLANLAQEKIDDHLQFSVMAVEELKELIAQVILSVEQAMRSRTLMSPEAVHSAILAEGQVNHLEDNLRERHILRLANHECLPESGIIFLDSISNMERISDHALNIAEYVDSEL